MNSVQVNHVFELEFQSAKHYANTTSDVLLDAVISNGSSTWTVPCFYRGNGRWAFRFAPDAEGEYTYELRSSDVEDKGVSRERGCFTAYSAAETNPAYAHGRLALSANGKYLAWRDGTPFFWLSDNWSMCLSRRLSEEMFEELVANRVRNGFNVIQLSAGQFPDMMPFDDRAESENGFPWNSGFTEIRPEYYELADKRIKRIVDAGMVPFIIGTWGHLIQFASRDFIRLHWRNLIARYSAYPVVFGIAGEGTMMIHGDFRFTPEENRPFREVLLDGDKREAHGERARRIWTEIGQYIRDTDPFGNLLTITPTADGYPYPHNASYQVTDAGVIDLELIHDYNAANLPDRIQTARKNLPGKPVISANPMDSLNGSSETQVRLFWRSVFHGAAGIQFSATGIYFVNRENSYFGPSGHGCTWSFETMRDALRSPGAERMGQCKALLTGIDYETLKPHPEWVIGPQRDQFLSLDVMTSTSVDLPPILAAGTDSGVRLFYIPAYLSREAFLSRKPRLKIGSQPVRATLYALSTMTPFDFGVASPDKNGDWIMHYRHCFYQPLFGDLLLVLDPTAEIRKSDEVYHPEDAMEVPQEDDSLLLAVLRHS